MEPTALVAQFDPFVLEITRYAAIHQNLSKDICGLYSKVPSVYERALDRCPDQIAKRVLFTVEQLNYVAFLNQGDIAVLKIGSKRLQCI